MTKLIKIFFLMAYLNMNSRVTIGQVFFENISSLDIDQDINTVSDKAVIELPRHYKELNGKPVLNYIKPGDIVKIEFGYNGNLFTEFQGFVKHISADTPLEIECDELYQLRQNNLVKSYKAVTLRQLLRDITAGMHTFNGKAFAVDCPDVNLGKFLIDNASAYNVLESIRSDYGFFTKVYGDTLYVGWAFDWNPEQTERHVYAIGENVKSAKDLKWKRKDDFNTKIRVKINHKDGKNKFVEAGSKNKNAAVLTVDKGARSEAEAKQIAEARLKKVVYEGFTGSILGFGIPRVNAGDSLRINDLEQPERESTYLVQKVEKRYDTNGISRKCTISYKI